MNDQKAHAAYHPGTPPTQETTPPLQRDEMNVPKVFPPAEFIHNEITARAWSISDLAEALGWPVNRTTDLINSHVQVTATVAERLARAFGTSGALWLNLQKQYDKEYHHDR